jgi:hypothetical protein
MTESNAINPTMSQNEEQPVHTPLGWILVISSLCYATFSYYGLGPPPGGLPTDWWHPRTFMLDWPVVGGWVDRPALGAVVLSLPAILLAVGVFFTTRSAVARAISLSYVFVVLFFGLAGFGAAGAWEFLSWRFTALMELSGLAIGFAIASPLLVRSWLRLPRSLQLVLYLPLFFVLMAAVRGATGTSEHLPFLISPWPTFTAFGLQTGVFVIVGFLFSVSLGVLSLSNGLAGRPLAMLGLLIALALPALWMYFGVVPLGMGAFLAVVAVSAMAIGLAQIGLDGGDRRERLQHRGLHLGLGAALTFLPIFAGGSLATADYALNRHIRAPKVIAALQRHMEQESNYPEHLDQLLEGSYIDEEPVPRIGFAFLSDLGLADEVNYRYNEYGSSYVIEFDSTLWIQCAYSGQYIFPEERDDYSAEELAEMEAESGWSCLAKQPNLFGDDTATEEDPDA